MDNNITILYVDDEDLNLFIFKKSFGHKYTVLTANSGRTGLEQLQGHADDIIVVISDMKMPIMSGLDFIKQARNNYKNIAYFILTGFEFSNEIDEALTNNVVQKFFTKPFDFEEIDSAISEVAKQFE